MGHLSDAMVRSQMGDLFEAIVEFLERCGIAATVPPMIWAELSTIFQSLSPTWHTTTSSFSSVAWSSAICNASDFASKTYSCIMRNSKSKSDIAPYDWELLLIIFIVCFTEHPHLAMSMLDTKSEHSLRDVIFDLLGRHGACLVPKGFDRSRIFLIYHFTRLVHSNLTNCILSITARTDYAHDNMQIRHATTIYVELFKKVTLVCITHPSCTYWLSTNEKIEPSTIEYRNITEWLAAADGINQDLRRFHQRLLQHHETKLGQELVVNVSESYSHVVAYSCIISLRSITDSTISEHHTDLSATQSCRKSEIQESMKTAMSAFVTLTQLTKYASTRSTLHDDTALWHISLPAYQDELDLKLYLLDEDGHYVGCSCKRSSGSRVPEIVSFGKCSRHKSTNLTMAFLALKALIMLAYSDQEAALDFYQVCSIPLTEVIDPGTVNMPTPNIFSEQIVIRISSLIHYTQVDVTAAIQQIL